MYVNISYFGKELGRITRGEDGELVAESESNAGKILLNKLIEDYDYQIGGTEDNGTRWDGFEKVETTDDKWFEHLSEHLPDGFEASAPIVDSAMEKEELGNLLQSVDDFKNRVDLMDQVEAFKNYVDNKYGVEDSETEQSGVSKGLE